MSFEFTMGAGGLPAGMYFAEFIGGEASTDEANNKKYGPGLVLKWRVIGGEYDTQEAWRIVSQKLSPKSNLAKFAVALKGGPIALGEKFRLADYLGVRGQLLVGPNDDGTSVVPTAFVREQPPKVAQPHLPTQQAAAVEQPLGNGQAIPQPPMAQPTVAQASQPAPDQSTDVF